jgi:hypothetical protein
MAAAEAREREAEVVDGAVVREIESPGVVDAEEAPPVEPEAPARAARRRRAPRPAAAPKAAKEPKEKKATKSRSGGRKKPAVAADA